MNLYDDRPAGEPRFVCPVLLEEEARFFWEDVQPSVFLLSEKLGQDSQHNRVPT